MNSRCSWLSCSVNWSGLEVDVVCIVVVEMFDVDI